MRLETERLTIRPFQRFDLDAYAEIVADPDVMRLVTGSPQTREEAEAYLAECIVSERENGFSRYAVFRKDAGELIGFCGYRLIDGEVDLGWRYAKKTLEQWLRHGSGPRRAELRP